MRNLLRGVTMFLAVVLAAEAGGADRNFKATAQREQSIPRSRLARMARDTVMRRADRRAGKMGDDNQKRHARGRRPAHAGRCGDLRSANGGNEALLWRAKNHRRTRHGDARRRLPDLWHRRIPRDSTRRTRRSSWSSAAQGQHRERAALAEGKIDSALATGEVTHEAAHRIGRRPRT